MLQRFSNVILYGCLLISALLIFIGIFSFEWIAFIICIISACFLGMLGWSIRYILTGEKLLHPKIVELLILSSEKLSLKISELLVLISKKLLPKVKQIINCLIAPESWSETSLHPWRRYFARMLDTTINGTICFIFIAILLYFIAPDFFESFFSTLDGPIGQLLGVIITTFLATFVNAVFIGFTGSSFGKLLFGIKVKSKNNKIGYKNALKREVSIWIKGLGCGIPIVSLLTLVTAYKKLLRSGRSTWDEELGYTVLYKNNNINQLVLNGLGLVLIVLSIGMIKYIEKLDQPPAKISSLNVQADPIAVELSKVAKKLNALGPKKIDDITTLEYVSSEKRIVTYHYSLNRPVDSDEDLLRTIKQNIIPTTCQNSKQFLTIKEYGVVYRYSYMIPNRAEPLLIDVDINACNMLDKSTEQDFIIQTQ